MKPRSAPRRRRLAVEPLEARTVPTVLLAESEPNDTPFSGDPLPRLLGDQVRVTGAMNAPGDRDWFRIDLKTGDVLGASLKGLGDLDPMLDLFDSAGNLVIGCDDSPYIGFNDLPVNSPLPRGHVSIHDSEIYCVLSTPGTYYLQVSAFDDETDGKYTLDLVVARPGMEAQPVGTHQKLFVDFDGAHVQIPGHNWQITSLRDALPAWGLTAADENAVIDEVTARLTDKVSAFVRANGPNGDYAATGVPGQFDIEILNSRDDPDTFGADPLVSKMAIGLTDDPELADVLFGFNETIDVGNFQTDEQGVVSVNFVPSLLASFPVQAPATPIQQAAEYIAIIAAHEFAHQVGCFHTDYSTTDPSEGVPTFMDRSFESPLGPDLTFGTADDQTLQLAADLYHRDEFFRGLNDTLGTFAFGLSTGMAAAGPRPHAVRPTDSAPDDDDPIDAGGFIEPATIRAARPAETMAPVKPRSGQATEPIQVSGTLPAAPTGPAGATLESPGGDRAAGGLDVLGLTER